jgi:opacity protein-like surface antigen
MNSHQLNEDIKMKKILLVVMLVLLTSPAYAVVGIAVGARGGIATNVNLSAVKRIDGLSIDRMSTIGMQFKFGALPKIDLIFTADYYWKSQDFKIPATSENVEFTVHNLALTASAVYPFYRTRLVTPYVGFGLSSHSLAFSGKGSWGTVAIPADDTRMGYQLIGGAYLNLPVIPIMLTGEARINWIQTDIDKSHFISLTLSANFGML